jgi:thioredoxin reductase (NADPH)
VIKEMREQFMYEAHDNAIISSNVPPFRAELAYPHLTDEMIERIHLYGTLESSPDRSTLFIRDERQVDMFVIIEGNIEVYISTDENQEYLL